ncbi:MAG: cupin domain-containing protein [Colwellia sp.]
MNNEAQKWIKHLSLKPHPEGGFFANTYTADEKILKNALPDRYSGDRSFSTGIYFLIGSENFSALHRLKSDEMWHFYDGESLTVHVFDENGKYSPIHLGRNIEKGEKLQAVVKAGDIFGASIESPDAYSLVGCTVAPGFQFEDFELMKRAPLIEKYPEHKVLIEKLTRI